MVPQRLRGSAADPLDESPPQFGFCRAGVAATQIRERHRRGQLVKWLHLREPAPDGECRDLASILVPSVELHPEHCAGHGADWRADHGPLQARVVAGAALALDGRAEVRTGEEPRGSANQPAEQLAAGWPVTACRHRRRRWPPRDSRTNVAERAWRTAEVPPPVGPQFRRDPRWRPLERLRYLAWKWRGTDSVVQREVDGRKGHRVAAGLRPCVVPREQHRRDDGDTHAHESRAPACSMSWTVHVVVLPFPACENPGQKGSAAGRFVMLEGECRGRGSNPHDSWGVPGF